MRRMLRWGLAASLLVPGCAPSPGGLEPTPGRAAPAPAPSRAAPAPACADETPLPATLLQPGSVLLFGEIHGVREIPAAFGEAVCAVARTRLPVEVGLEVPGTEQARLDAFVASPGGPADVGALTASDFWTREFQDGRSSQAMLALIERMRRLREEGLPVHVFLFDLGSSKGIGERDKLMAENIAAHVRAHPEALAMALTGEVHAWKAKGAPWNADLLPMGWHLVNSGLEVRSLGRVTPAGTAWICPSGSPGECGSRTMGAWGALPSGRTTGIELLPEPSERGNDGLFGVSSMTASPPASSVSVQQ